MPLPLPPLPLHRRGIPASRMALGCMGLGGPWDATPIDQGHLREAHAAVDAALEAGINLFDHADIYARGKAEEVFGRVLRERPGLRDRIFLQSKCGIRLEEGPEAPGRYDFSEEHILEAVEGSLRRLGVDHLDLVLLHRPDPLGDPEAVARALDRLSREGKVRWFGVSNMSAAQIQFLAAFVPVPLVVNQLELSLAHLDFLDAGVHLNQATPRGHGFPEGTLEYCRREQIQIQAWGPLARGRLTGRPLEGPHARLQPVVDRVARMARERGTAPEAVALAWLMAHPAGIQPVVGTRRPERIRACAGALTLSLSREEWYALYVAARGEPLP